MAQAHDVTFKTSFKLRWIGGGVNRWYDEGLPLPKNHHCINIIVDCHLYCSTKVQQTQIQILDPLR